MAGETVCYWCEPHLKQVWQRGTIRKNLPILSELTSVHWRSEVYCLPVKIFTRKHPRRRKIAFFSKIIPISCGDNCWSLNLKRTNCFRSKNHFLNDYGLVCVHRLVEFNSDYRGTLKVFIPPFSTGKDFRGSIYVHKTSEYRVNSCFSRKLADAVSQVFARFLSGPAKHECLKETIIGHVQSFAEAFHGFFCFFFGSKCYMAKIAKKTIAQNLWVSAWNIRMKKTWKQGFVVCLMHVQMTWSQQIIWNVTVFQVSLVDDDTFKIEQNSAKSLIFTEKTSLSQLFTRTPFVKHFMEKSQSTITENVKTSETSGPPRWLWKIYVLFAR